MIKVAGAPAEGQQDNQTRQYAVAAHQGDMPVVVRAGSPKEALELAGNYARHLRTAPAAWVWWRVDGLEHFERVIRGAQ